jgi:hypothetical protein
MASSFHFFFLIESNCSGKTKEEKEMAKTSSYQMDVEIS